MAQENTSATPYSADPMFQQYYDEILASMTPSTVEYTAPTVDEIASQISSYLRPAVDRQIENRRLQTAQQRAATDVDAASRGILPSTWVTDIKQRLMQSEAADVAAAESDYRAQLLQGVYNRQAAESDRAYQIAMFNAQMRQQAEADAYSRAGDMYNLYLQNKKSGPGKKDIDLDGDDTDGDDTIGLPLPEYLAYLKYLRAADAKKKTAASTRGGVLKPATAIVR